MQHSRRLLHLAQRGVCVPSLGFSCSQTGSLAGAASPACLGCLRNLVSVANISGTAQPANSTERKHNLLLASQLPAQQQRLLFGLSAEDLHKDYKERRLIG